LLSDSFTSLSLFGLFFILFVILGFIIIKGASVLVGISLTKSPEEGMTSGRIYPAIVGTLYLVLGSSLISFPIGVMSGIFMMNMQQTVKITKFIRIMTNNLSGDPLLYLVYSGWHYL
jgi:phosphate transport system permease protein